MSVSFALNNEVVAAAPVSETNTKKRKLVVDEKENAPPAKRGKITFSVKPAFQLLLKRVSHQKTEDNLLKAMRTSPHAVELWNQAKMIAPDLGVRFVSTKRQPTLGACNYRNQIISIQKEASEECQLAVLLFELCNMTQALTFKKIEDLARIGKIKSAMEFAMQYESVEYLSVRKFSEVMRTCIQKDGWAESLYKHVATTDYFPDFQSYWKVQLEMGHAQYYIDNFNDLCKELEAREAAAREKSVREFILSESL